MSNEGGLISNGEDVLGPGPPDTFGRFDEIESSDASSGFVGRFPRTSEVCLSGMWKKGCYALVEADRSNGHTSPLTPLSFFISEKLVFWIFDLLDLKEYFVLCSSI
jgi:hypothetical protein